MSELCGASWSEEIDISRVDTSRQLKVAKTDIMLEHKKEEPFGSPSYDYIL